MNRKQEQYQSFVDLICEHQGILHRLSAVYATQPVDKEDLYQEMLLQTWRSFGSYNGQAKFSTWLYRVALNTALVYRRKDSRRRDLPTASGETAETTAFEESRPQADVEMLYGCIQELPELDRAIILLHLEQHAYQEIADITGLSRGNVSVRLVRIKARLRQLLIAKGYHEG